MVKVIKLNQIIYNIYKLASIQNIFLISPQTKTQTQTQIIIYIYIYIICVITNHVFFKFYYYFYFPYFIAISYNVL